MEVKLLNSDEIKDFFKRWGIFSCKCYNTDVKYADKVGKKCLESNHMSGSRSFYFIFEISGISRACSLELNRHNVGVCLNQQSQRYVNMDNTEFVIPPVIKNNPEAYNIYMNILNQCKEGYKQIKTILVDNGRTEQQAKEDSRFCLPEATYTCGTWGFTLEALINFMNKRLCNRAMWEIRQLAEEMRKAVIEVLPELTDYLVPNCKKLLYCPESNGCGLMLNKRDFQKLISKE